MDERSTNDLAKLLENELSDRYGPVLTPSVLQLILGYASAEAFRKSIERKTFPVPVFRIPNRRGYFALSRDVACWLARQRATSGNSDRQEEFADSAPNPIDK